MNGLGALRKGYAELTPTERASMFFTEAAGRQREEVVLALRPPTANEAIQEAKAMIAMLIVAGHALTTALINERNALAFLAREHGFSKEKIDKAMPALTYSFSMVLALQKLEKETGHSFFAAASLLDSGRFLASKVEGWDQEIELDIDDALGELRKLWEAGKKMIGT
jgi:hypothetical protein